MRLRFSLRLARNRSARSSTASSARAGSERVSAAMVFMLLNRKCGRMRACRARIARAGLQLDVAAPLAGDVEVAQCERADDRANAEVGGEEALRRDRQQQIGGARPEQGAAAEPQHAQRHQGDDRQHAAQRQGAGRRQRQRGQPHAQQAQRRGTAHARPQQEQRGARQVEPEAEPAALSRDRQHDRGERDDQDHRQHRARRAEIGQVQRARVIAGRAWPCSARRPRPGEQRRS